MTEEIIRKLSVELNDGIKSEVQVVYLLAGIRKLVERDKIGSKYSALNFHCDWALHALLDRAGAKDILSQFDVAHPLLKGEGELHDFAPEIDRAITRISKMERFKIELSEFLTEYHLPLISQNRSDGWAQFLYYYTRVIEDIPLVVNESSPNAATNIGKVTVHFESAKKTQKIGEREEQFYKVTWRIFDKTGESGEVSVINSFSV